MIILKSSSKYSVYFPGIIYFFKVNNRNTWQKWEICFIIYFVLFLTLNIFHTFF